MNFKVNGLKKEDSDSGVSFTFVDMTNMTPDNTLWLYICRDRPQSGIKESYQQFYNGVLSCGSELQSPLPNNLVRDKKRIRFERPASRARAKTGTTQKSFPRINFVDPATLTSSPPCFVLAKIEPLARFSTWQSDEPISRHPMRTFKSNNPVLLLLLLSSSCLPREASGSKRAQMTRAAQQDIAIDSSQNSTTSNIVGGTSVTNASKYPFFAIPSSNAGGGGTLCGASLVHPDILVSAAHCEGAFSNKDVYIGSTQINGGNAKEKILASYEFLHPDYDDVTKENDIMLIKLSKRSTVTPVLYTKAVSVPATGITTTVIGFGSTDFNGDASSTLMEVKVVVVDHDTCEASYGDLSKTVQFCAGTEGKDACQGDSGGPLLSSGGVLVGIVSFGYQCGTAGYPTVYTRAGGLVDFIKNGICNMSDRPPSSCTVPPNLTDCSKTAIACKGFFGNSGIYMHKTFTGICLDSCFSIAVFPTSGWLCGKCP